MMSIKHYTDPELLEINTLENAIYMAMQNDVSHDRTSAVFIRTSVNF